MTETAGQTIDELEASLRRGDRILLAADWVLLAIGVSGVAVQVAMWPDSGGPIAAVVWRTVVILAALMMLATGKRIRIMQEHIRWQREQIRADAGRRAG